MKGWRLFGSPRGASSIAELPAAARAMWKSLAIGTNNNTAYLDDVITPAFDKLESDATRLRAEFVKNFNAKNADLLKIGTSDIEEAVSWWRGADKIVSIGQSALDAHNYAAAGNKFDTANQWTRDAQDQMKAGRKLLMKAW